VGFKSTVHPTEIDTLESQQTEKIETEVKDVNDSIGYRKHTGVRNIVQRFLLGCPVHTISYMYYSPSADRPPSKKETPRGRVLNRITRQLLHHVSTVSFESYHVHFHWNIRLLPARPG
jgi:hypothetical protein